MLGYDEDDDSIVSGTKAARAALAKPVAKGKYSVRFVGMTAVKRVKRINLNFEQEDQVNFKRRLAYAEEAREQTKALLRYDHFITSQPAAQMRPMQPQTLQGIHDRVMLGMTSSTVKAMEAEEKRRPRF